MSCSPGRHFGVAPGLDVYYRGRNDRFNQFASDTRLTTASAPDGYDVKGLVPARTAGSMSARVPFADATFTGNLLQGGPMVGSGSITWTTPNGNLGLIVSMSGTGAITLTAPNANLRLVIGMDGTGSMTFTGSGGLSMIVPFDGTGSFGITGSGDLRGRLSMSGSWTPFSELSPESLAAAVWDAVASANNDAGTMGQKLNSAASGGVDLNALAAAVWEYATRTLTSATNSTFMTPLAFRASTTTTAGDPGTGRLRWNNATQSAATELYIDTVTDDGLDIDNYIDLVPVGAMVYVQDRDNANNVQKWLITSIVHNAGWTQLGVSNLSFAGGNLPNNHTIVVMFNNQIAGALSTEQSTQLAELHRIHGLQLGFPLTVTATSRVSDGITQNLSDDGTTVTVTRT